MTTARPAIPAPPYEGGCLCGAVRYALSARPISIHACHCNDCRKMSGVTHIVMVGVRRQAFATTGAIDQYVKTADSGRTIDIVRCASCGTRLWHVPHSAPTLVFLTAGTLDDSRWVIPTAHVWTDRASSANFAPDSVQVAGQPEGREALFDSFSRIYGGGL